jgi:TonB-dependent receptor
MNVTADRLTNKALLLAAASLASMTCSAAAFAQQSSTTQGTLGSAPVDQAASPSAVTADAVQEAQSPSPSATDGAAGEEIVVTGIRGSQIRAINVKRSAASVVDAISAEDIGKLPDVTISDSLQRIPGVQIRREAGEGAGINIRGLPQVTTLINGEQYLGANSITSVQPNFNDIPSQLFSGADVIKSTTADLLNAGITGTVNLRTRRPFDLKDGITVAATAQGDYGDRVKKWNPNVNGLLGWHGDRVGIVIGAAYADVKLANLHNGIQEGYGAGFHTEATADALSCGGFSPTAPVCSGNAPRPRGTAVAGGIDVNGDGDANDGFMTPQAFTAWDRVTQRKRFGLNGAFQAELSDALELTGDAFFTRQIQNDRTAGFQMQAVNWQAADFVPTLSRDTGVIANGVHVNTVQGYDYQLGNFDSYSENNRIRSQSQNYNLQLKYDKGGPFRATLRGIYGKAKQNRDNSYLQYNLSNGQQWQPSGIGNYPAAIGGDRAFNPNGYSVNTVAGVNSLRALVDFSGNQPSYTLPGQLTNLMSNMANYGLKTTSSEGNSRTNGDLKVIRGDVEYEAASNLTFTAGARYSERSNRYTEFERVAPLYAGQGASNAAGCLVKWKAFDVTMNGNTCSAGDASGFYTAGLARPATDPIFNGQVRAYDLPAKGVPALYVLDPKAMDQALAFQNSFYPGNVDHVNPGASYAVGVKQTSGYVQLNFKDLDLFGINVAGNGGLRVINTDLDIRQNIVGATNPYGLSNEPGGELQTKRSFTDLLPAINVAFDFTQKLRLRLAMTRTMTLLNLDQWGGGLNPFYAIDTATGTFRVTGGNQTGNPQLDPWRATNWDASLEYYMGQSSLISIGAFYIDVDSFIQSGTVTRTDLPDNDGVVRNRTVLINTQIQGQGGTLKGVELNWKQSFQDLGFMPTFLQDFGIDSNFTFAPSTTGDRDLSGKKVSFQDNSKYQANAALYYQGHGLQARVAWNYRSERSVSSNFVNGLTGTQLYQMPTNYVDASVSYDITPNFTVFAQGANLTGEYERYYIVWKDQKAYNNIYERRFSVGARAKF